MSFDPVNPPYNHTDPTARFLSSSALDFLLIEVVPMSYRITAETTPAEGEGGVGEGENKEGGTVDEDEEREAVFYRLEGIGYRVGRGLVERFAKDRGRFGDTLDVIKFVCKDLWGLVFRKQVDNLKTNHRGVYVLTDNNFRPLSRMSVETGGRTQQAAVVRAQPFLWVPCGIVRGALAAMGIQATVQAETTELPGAVFQIKTLPAK
ncbi:putative trafficking protein particle complex subunit 6B [Triangularia verruculosa]|uniref:Trafficking protein particle complex subunit 6B n=1 Tax=Triangularia verruculosa TaxID=2587418 RepID=A0AAN7AS81_9PEZI|nr:putative trafficking protein particle complex subunit 6B [Triangularia verruculosa]